MWALRTQVSLLIEAGHQNPHSYTPGRVVDEAAIVSRRLAEREASRAILIQRALATVPIELSKSALKQANKSAKEFKEIIDEMLGE